VAESGFAGFEDYTWVGVFLPTGAPAAVAQKINADVEALLQQADFKTRLSGIGFEPVGGSMDSFGKYVKAEHIKWAKVVRETGAKPE